MVKAICIFEDDQYSKLLPLVYFRPVYDLRCGILTLKEKIINYYPDTPIVLHSRDYLGETLSLKNQSTPINIIDDKIDSCLFINGRALVNKEFIHKIPLNGKDELYRNGHQIVAFRASGNNLIKAKELLNQTIKYDNLSFLPVTETNIPLLNYTWDFINNNGKEIINDFNLLLSNKQNNLLGKIYDGVHLINKNQIYIEKGAVVKPGVVLDAEEGPIYIGKNALIYPNVVIEGPCFIGEKTKIKVGAKIYENTSIGEVCKVGGEVEESIIHSYSNKQHDGFLGHAYLGSWVNLGADTNNSDLKNNYGNVKVFVNGTITDSGSMFVGLTMGDHSKCGINTMFNTGTVVGVSSNIYGGNFPPKYIPSFSWGGSESLTTYKLEKSMEVAKRVMARRNFDFTTADEKLFNIIFKLTQEERNKFNN